LPFAVPAGDSPMLLECESANAMVAARIDPLSAGGTEAFPWSGSIMNRG